MRPLAPDALIALGSNLGDRAQLLRRAIARLAELPATELLRASRFYATHPVGPPQPDYLNAAVLLRTGLTAHELLQQLLAIERDAGRVRRERWGARTLDLDLILFGETIIATAELSVPHPRAHERLFVLEPAAEIAPGMRHPILGCTIAQLLERLRAGEQAPG